MGKSWSTPAERLCVRNAMLSVLRACAREVRPMPSYSMWPAELLKAANITVTGRLLRRVWNELKLSLPDDLDLRVAGRHRQVRLMINGRWTPFTPLNCALASSAAYAQRVADRVAQSGSRAEFDPDQESLSSLAGERRHFRQLLAVADQRSKPVTQLYV